VIPETVHTVGVAEAKLTGMPELAVAVSVTWPAVFAVFGIAVKVMVWLAGVTVKLWLTDGAEAHLGLLPACVAWMVHVPTDSNVTVDPEMVQTDVVCELKLTARPELAVALTVNGAEPYARLASGLKVMV